MDNVQIREMMKAEPQEIVNIIEHRVRNIDYIEDQRRHDILDYIAAKVKGQVAPFLRLARSVRRHTYPKWVRFNELLESYGLETTLTRENNYSPVPSEWLDETFQPAEIGDLLDYIDFFNDLHAEEDRRKEGIFKKIYIGWVTPALLYAFEKVDVSRSDREVVTYVCSAFYSRFVDIRAESQGLIRIRRGGEWIYYHRQEIDDFTFTETDIMQVIFHENRRNYPPLKEMEKRLTKRQIRFVIALHNYIREDVSRMNTEQFYEKYPHKRMNYRRTAEELEINYDSFAKNIQRIKKRLA